MPSSDNTVVPSMLPCITCCIICCCIVCCCIICCCIVTALFSARSQLHALRVRYIFYCIAVEAMEASDIIHKSGYIIRILIDNRCHCINYVFYKPDNICTFLSSYYRKYIKYISFVISFMYTSSILKRTLFTFSPLLYTS